jgi:hypothetical protein
MNKMYMEEIIYRFTYSKVIHILGAKQNVSESVTYNL